MMGAGKSTVGRALAGLADVPFQDTDNLLEMRFGRRVSSIFSIYGEESFRGHETSMLKTLDRKPGVLATGGGIVTVPENWTEFQRLGTTIFMDVPPNQLKERLAKSKKRRPLLEYDDWEARFDAMFEARRPVYCQADIIFEIDAAHLEEAADRLYARLTS
ncbi:MAG: shikimate kinase [Chthonomonas sp.]|nr:shikimate kinase [Chthonomonas sp.]